MAAVAWFMCGAAFCFMVGRARQDAKEFEERLEALEDELDARAEGLQRPGQTH